MLKKIPPSDISIRPFKVYKEWEFDSTSNDIDVLLAEELTNISEAETSGNNLTFKKHSLYSQIKSQFYNGNEDNPFTRFGSKSLTYVENDLFKERFLSGSAKVVSIPQKYIGEGIKKGSFHYTEDGLNYIDDTYGNIIRTGGITIYINDFDILAGTINMTDAFGNTYSATIDEYFLDLETNIFTIEYNATVYSMSIVSFDAESGKMILLTAPFISSGASSEQFGNVFYHQGIFIFTKDIDTFLTANWSFSYKSTETIYEHEYLLITSPDEFNISTNPTAVVEIGKIEEDWTTSDGTNANFLPYTIKVQTNPGTKYIRKLATAESGNTIDYRYQSKVNSSVYGGFEQIESYGSTDVTGSYLAPYITTIGLYNDECELLAVAKLPQPIKSIPDIELNFIVRFDT